MVDRFSRQYGSLYDRGRCDSYYYRKRDPHWYPNGTHKGERIKASTQEEIDEYNQGYNDNQRIGDHKEWD